MSTTQYSLTGNPCQDFCEFPDIFLFLSLIKVLIFSVCLEHSVFPNVLTHSSCVTFDFPNVFFILILNKKPLDFNRSFEKALSSSLATGREKGENIMRIIRQQLNMVKTESPIYSFYPLTCFIFLIFNTNILNHPGQTCHNEINSK